MAKNSITDYDNIANNNTDIQSVDIAENCAPSGINNAIREMMADLADVNDGTVALTSPKAVSLSTDTINESTTDNGVAVDGMTIKDGAVGTTASPATANLTAINGGQIGGRRNLIYNGAMQVAQRGTQTTGVVQGGYYCADRWRILRSASSGAIYTVETVADAPDGFTRSFKITTTTADATLDSDDYMSMAQSLEGLDLQHLKYGSASALPVTISFWVKSSLTGDCAVSLYAGSNRIIGTTITINSASTWEKKEITIVGDTASAIDNDNTEGFRLWIFQTAGSAFTSVDNASWATYAPNNLAYGQTLNLQGTLNATFQITGVQMEVGSVTTEFEHRSYGEELALCQRYYEVFASGTYPGAFQGKCSSAGGGGGSIYVPYKVTKRANGTVSSVTMRNANTGATASASAAFISTHGHAYGTGGVAGSTGDAMHINSIVTVEAEL